MKNPFQIAQRLTALLNQPLAQTVNSSVNTSTNVASDVDTIQKVARNSVPKTSVPPNVNGSKAITSATVLVNLYHARNSLINRFVKTTTSANGTPRSGIAETRAFHSSATDSTTTKNATPNLTAHTTPKPKRAGRKTKRFLAIVFSNKPHAEERRTR